MPLIKLDKIWTDLGTQSRVEINQALVKEFAEIYRGEDHHFPDVEVFDDGNRLILADGFHRYAGAEAAGEKEISTNIRPGTLEDAIEFAVGANHAHGLRRSNEDKRHCVMMLLSSPRWRDRTDRWIADKCGVDHKTVAAYREAAVGEIPQHEENGQILCDRCRRVGPTKDCKECEALKKPRATGRRTGSDNRTYKARKPRKKKKTTPKATPPKIRLGEVTCPKCGESFALPAAPLADLGVEIPESLRTPAFLEAWEEWQRYRQERKPKLTPISAKKQLKTLAKWGAERAIAAIDLSISSTWQGIFESKAEAKREGFGEKFDKIRNARLAKEEAEDAKNKRV